MTLNSPLQQAEGVEVSMPRSADDEMAAIRAAIAPELYETAPKVEEAPEVSVVKSEVSYQEGASPLFMAIENAEWNLALQYIEDDPSQVRLWVVSTGTVETTFNWSLWRRLSLHEACRRQAPAWLISALLSAYPESAKETTQFGELPLHLAVECGASPDVVNVLVVAHWMGVVTTDQSGRTPLEILNESEMLALDDHAVVMDSLTRGKACFDELEQAHNQRIAQIEEVHASGLRAIHDQHSDDLALEQETQDKLLQEMERLGGRIDATQMSEAAQKSRVATLVAYEQSLQAKLLTLEDTIVRIQNEKQIEMDKVLELEKVIENKNEQLAASKSRSLELENDLQMITTYHGEEVQRNVDRAQRHARKMVESFSNLSAQLEEHGDGLKSLLTARGIQIPSRKVKTEEEKDPNIQEEFMLDDEDAILAATTAASSALKF